MKLYIYTSASILLITLLMGNNASAENKPVSGCSSFLFGAEITPAHYRQAGGDMNRAAAIASREAARSTTRVSSTVGATASVTPRSAQFSSPTPRNPVPLFAREITPEDYMRSYRLGGHFFTVIERAARFANERGYLPQGATSLYSPDIEVEHYRRALEEASESGDDFFKTMALAKRLAQQHPSNRAKHMRLFSAEITDEDYKQAAQYGGDDLAIMQRAARIAQERQDSED